MRALVLLLCATLAGCIFETAPRDVSGLSSFDVAVTGVFVPAAGGTARAPLGVVSSCAAQHGGEEKVPASVRGTSACPYLMPRSDVEIELTAAAMDTRGNPLPFDGPVSFRVTPGVLSGSYAQRWGMMTGGVAKGVARVKYLYGEVRVWVEDAPVQVAYADGGVGGDVSKLPSEPATRSFATGLAPIVYFEEPTLAKVQIPEGFDNRSSRFDGQFLTVGRNPESPAGAIKQSCSDDPTNDGQPATLVVTGTDPGGFFVTDLTACRLREDLKDPATGQTVVRAAEPDGFLPGTYGSLYIFNFGYPEGLDVGDLLWSLSGTIQEFTSTTQLTSPAWSIREKVRQLPQAEWNKYLQQVKPYELNLRTCGVDNGPGPYVTDVLCGQNRRNLKLESLESTLVRVRNVRFPARFQSCDLNGDGNIPAFCESEEPDVGGIWRDCNFDQARVDCTKPRNNDERELCCSIACTTGQGAAEPGLCSEQNAFDSFGQFLAELPGAGDAEETRDTALSGKSTTLMLGGASVETPADLPIGAEMHLWCTAPVHYRFGNAGVVATNGDPLLTARTGLDHRLAGEGRLAVIAAQSVTASDRCVLSVNTHTRINVSTDDGIPELKLRCSETDANPDSAEQCKRLHAATFDVTGHLRQIQAGRPRWLVIARGQDDVCCHPGPGMECPRPLKKCP